MDSIEYANVHSTPSPENLARLNVLVEVGVTPVVMATYAFPDIESAFARLQAGSLTGKIAVSLAGPGNL